jgi:hypothetical protein
MYIRQEISDSYGFAADELFKQAEQQLAKQDPAGQSHNPSSVWGYKLFAGCRSSRNLDDVMEAIITAAKHYLQK